MKNYIIKDITGRGEVNSLHDRDLLANYSGKIISDNGVSLKDYIETSDTGDSWRCTEQGIELTHSDKVIITKGELPPDFSIWGNKGAVWSDNQHIIKRGQNTTLCGIPPLSNNWAVLWGKEYAQCPDCIEKLLEIVARRNMTLRT